MEGRKDSGARALFHTDGRNDDLLVTIGADRPAGSRGFEELVSMARSAKIFLPVRTVTWPSSGTRAGPPACQGRDDRPAGVVRLRAADVVDVGAQGRAARLAGGRLTGRRAKAESYYN